MNITKTKNGLKIKGRLPGEHYIIPRNEAKKFARRYNLDWEYIKNAPLGKL
jgi:hypothetical protein